MQHDSGIGSTTASVMANLPRLWLDLNQNSYNIGSECVLDGGRIKVFTYTLRLIYLQAGVFQIGTGCLNLDFEGVHFHRLVANKHPNWGVTQRVGSCCFFVLRLFFSCVCVCFLFFFLFLGMCCLVLWFLAINRGNAASKRNIACLERCFTFWRDTASKKTYTAL